MMVMDEPGSTGVPGGHESMEGNSGASGDGLSPDQKEMLERCLHALTHAKNDSQTIAALLLITRVCPANQLDSAMLRRVFEAVGLNLPARLLVTAVRGDPGSGLPAQELLSLGLALLAALSTDPDMAQHPQMLTSLPMLLGLLSEGPTWTPTKQRSPQTNQQDESGESKDRCNGDHNGSPQSSQSATADDVGGESACQPPPSSTVLLDEALASDCYQVLEALSAVPGGPERLLTRGAVPALCRAIEQNQTFSGQRGRPLLGLLLSHLGPQTWEKHSAQLKGILEGLSHEYCQAKEAQRLELCAGLLQFLPPQEGLLESGELRKVVTELWAAVRPLVQSKVSTAQLGPVLALTACLLDLCGWECAGPPKFCCLLVNRACVEVRMGLEEPPGTTMAPELQYWLTACYRIMEAAMEQACRQGLEGDAAQPQTSLPGLSLQQTRQVLGILEEAFSAVIFYLQQVDESRHCDPFVFATFRCLCAWLAEETSCLKEEVTSLLPFLIKYSRDHLQGGGDLKDLSRCMAEMSVAPGSQKNKWTGEHALRYLLPALCHLTAEEGPRQVLLSLDTLSLLIGFLQRGWERLQKLEGKAQTREPALETACSALLNIAVTEPDKVRKDSSFSELQKLLDEALPLLLHKPRLLVLAANFCTLGLMMGRTKVTPSDLSDPSERRFFSAALRFLLSALSPGHGSTPGSVAAAWEEGWEEVGELWRLSLQALGACCRARPGLTALVREQKWLASVLSLLSTGGSRTDAGTVEALQEALCALAQTCPACREEIREELSRGQASCLKAMSQLKKAVSQ